MKKIVYIMGAGRSGTTLLDIMLGNNPDIFSGGELNRFSKHGGVPNRVPAESETALFWDQFRNRMPSAWKQDNFVSIHRICKKYEYHTALLRQMIPFVSGSFKQYRLYIQTFFDTLASMVHGSIIIDSSKYPMRGFFLSKILKFEMAFIYVKRNPVDVVNSFQKKDVEQPSKSWIGANLYLLVVNLICEYAIKFLKRNHRTVTVYYNELISSPHDVLIEIGKNLDIDVSHSIHLAERGQPFKPGLLFDGNRIRLEKELVLRPARESEDAFRLKDKITMSLHRGWWNKLNYSGN